uniref:caspase-9 isoform X2 n=1 Tax=Myxine glutinosa TaxID=7769 RepID=UPI0035902408
MDENLRQLLRSLRVPLVKDMDPASLFDHLVTARIFTDDQVEDIKQQGTRRAQASKLLQELERRGPQAFPALVSALVETKQQHLADLLQPSLRPGQPLPKTKFDVNHKTSGTGVHDFSDKYKMTADPRGDCLIINNEKFQDGNNRPGSSIDTDNLRNFFSTNLLFSVIVREDLTAKEIMNELNELAAKDHGKADCCVVFIMSHGKEVRVESLIAPFIGDRCRSLTEKPKLFFIQACGGDKKDVGVAVKEDATDGRPVTFSDDDDNTSGNVDMVEIVDGKGELQVDASIYMEEEDETDAVPIVPQMADLLLAYSTTPGYVSFRQKEEGSWYVQALLGVLKSDAHKEDLLSMLTKVNDKLSADYQHGLYKQIGSSSMTLRKKLFFHL